MRAIDLVGQRFGRLMAVSVASPTRFGKRQYMCRCDCGMDTVVRGEDLRHGHTASCGCYRRDAGKRFRTHGGHRTTEWRSWSAAKNRCTNPRNDAYADYGGRGVAMCSRWASSFADFLADMGPKPSPKHSLDRWPDNSGNYEPGNCRWATPTEQSRNRRATGGWKCRPRAKDAAVRQAIEDRVPAGVVG